MNRAGPIGFLWGKWVRGEGYLNQHSIGLDALSAQVKGKSVAIVGNARSLQHGAFGPQIDTADVVIRMHAAPLLSAQSHGSRTNWLALGMPVAQSIITARDPDTLLWMARKRKRVRRRFLRRKGFYLHPQPVWDQMRDTLSAPPSTGVMLIDLAARSQAAQIDIYGFDFFTSLSLSGRRTADQVPHDFTAEKAFVMALADKDARINVHMTLTGELKT